MLGLIGSEPHQPHSIPPNWGAHSITGAQKSVPSSFSLPRESFARLNWNMKHYKSVKLGGALKQKCLYIAVTLRPFWKQDIYTW